MKREMWSTQDDHVLSDLTRTGHTADEIGQVLGRTAEAVRCRRRHIATSKRPTKLPRPMAQANVRLMTLVETIERVKTERRVNQALLREYRDGVHQMLRQAHGVGRQARG